jgi:bacterial/archaeal transporter family-2 protein
MTHRRPDHGAVAKRAAGHPMAHLDVRQVARRIRSLVVEYDHLEHRGRDPTVNGVAIALATAAGLAGSIQVAVMGRFGERVGVLEALLFSTAVQLVLAGVLLLAVRGGLGGLHNVGRTPAWMWIGGAMGLTVVTSITFAQPRLGATATIGILIAGQLVAGAVIDRFGLFGVERIDISAARAVGIVLLGIGAGLSLVR